MALALHSTYARDGDTPALKQAAAAATPIVQQHLDQIRGMRAS
jgi:putative membrane protein